MSVRRGRPRLRASSVVLAELVAALGTVVEDGGAFVGGSELEGMEVHLVVATAGALFLDGGFLWLFIVS